VVYLDFDLAAPFYIQKAVFVAKSLSLSSCAFLPDGHHRAGDTYNNDNVTLASHPADR
jgi:hypothetical protein